MKPLFPIILAVALSASSALAVSVTATLSADETAVGVPVQYQLRVDGTTNVSLPNDLGVDGLQSQLTSRSTQVSILNGRMTTSGVFSYTIVPMREGTFTIPPIDVDADGRKLRTTEQTLVVQPGTARPARPVPGVPAPPAGQAAAPDAAPAGEQLAFAELIVPRKSVYAGEVVPVEVRFYFNGNVPFRVMQEEPQMSGEGFTVHKFSPAKQTEEEVNGVRYHVLTYRTALTAVKAGPMPAPVASLAAVARVPGQAPAGMDDIFSQFFGGQGLPGFTDDREIKVETKPSEIQVKALPAAGRPASFNGAIGDFTVTATASPTKVAAGDPVTLKIDVSGRGNFEAMGEPMLVEADAWRAYPPTDRFEKNDQIGFSGTKTFEIPLIAQASQTQTPVAEFSFFDPIKDQYFTVRTQPVNVEAPGSPTAAATPVPLAEATASPTAPAAPATTEPSGWLTRETPRSWRSLAQEPAFWAVNGVAALAYLALLALALVRRARSGARAERAALVRDRNHAVAETQRSGREDGAFLDEACRALALQARLARAPGAPEYLESLERQGRDTTALRALLARADENKFSGGSVAVRLDPDERARFAAALKEICR